MDDRKALMAAILANPGEDTPRLALADWLQEHGNKHEQARAEFIRFQIEATKLPEKSAARKKLESAASKHHRKHFKAWVKPLSDIDPKLEPDVYQRYFKRGLLSHLWFDTGEFLLKTRQAALPDAIAAIGIEELLFYSPTKRIAEFVNSPVLRWTSGIQYPGADDKALELFASSPMCTHLNSVEFCEVLVTDAGLKAFAMTTAMTRLRELDISTEGGLTSRKPKFSAAGLVELLNSDRLRLVESFCLEAEASKFDAGPLFAATGLRKLKKLNITGPTRIADVAASRNLTNIESLELHNTEVSDSDADALITTRGLPRLKEIVLDCWRPPEDETAARLRAHFGERLTLE